MVFAPSTTHKNGREIFVFLSPEKPLNFGVPYDEIQPIFFGNAWGGCEEWRIWVLMSADEISFRVPRSLVDPFVSSEFSFRTLLCQISSLRHFVLNLFKAVLC